MSDPHKPITALLHVRFNCRSGCRLPPHDCAVEVDYDAHLVIPWTILANVPYTCSAHLYLRPDDAAALVRRLKALTDQSQVELDAPIDGILAADLEQRDGVMDVALIVESDPDNGLFIAARTSGSDKVRLFLDELSAARLICRLACIPSI